MVKLEKEKLRGYLMLLKKDMLFLTTLTLLSVISGTENNIYVTFFPSIIQYYNIEQSSINYLLRANFFGSFIVCLFVGPLVDSFGRKKIFILGMVLYTVGSLFCFLSNSFALLVTFRFFTGVAKSIVSVVGVIILFDKYTTNVSSKATNFISGTSALLISLIPICSVWISKAFNWHMVFILIPILTGTTLIISLFCVKETLPHHQVKKFNFKNSIQGYIFLLRNFEFMSKLLINKFSCAVYILFFSNASIIFVGHQVISEQVFSFYQTLNSAVFIVFSFLSIYITTKKDLDFTNNLGFFIFIFGSVSIFLYNILEVQNMNITFILIMFISAGSALMNGFLLQAVNLFPNLRGTAMSLSSTIGIVLVAREIRWSQVFFDGRITPTVTIIFITSIISLILYIMLWLRKNRT